MSTLNRTMTAYAQEALNQFVSKLAPLRAFSRDFSTVARSKGSAVAVPLVSNITATTFNQAYNGTGGTINTVTVNLNQHRIATVDLTDVQQLNTDVTMQKFAKQLGNAVAKIVLQDIWSVITTTNFGNAIVTTLNTNWNKAQVTALRKALAANDVDTDMLSLVVNTDLFAELLDDTSISYAMYYGGAEAIRAGKIPQLLGADVYESNVIPANGITLYGFMTHPDAIAVAMRAFDQVVPDGAYEFFETTTDPESGIALTQRLLYDPNTGKRHWSAECLFGYSAAVTKGLAIATGPN